MPTGKVPLMEEKVETNQLGSVELSDMGTNKWSIWLMFGFVFMFKYNITLQYLYFL